MTTGKTIVLTRQAFVGKIMFLLFNILSRLVIAFLPRSKCLLISWLQSPSSVILEPKNKVWHCFHCFLIYSPSGPIISWQIGGKTMETVRDFIFLSSKITADGDCSREIKRCLLLGRKAMTKLDSILKSRDITLPTKSKLCFLHLSCMDVSVGP